jgi:hypothetical protein
MFFHVILPSIAEITKSTFERLLSGVRNHMSLKLVPVGKLFSTLVELTRKHKRIIINHGH